MNLVGNPIDNRIEEQIHTYSSERPDYWSFRGKSIRRHAHAYLQYPAMMVPQMQRKLIKIICESSAGIKSVYDPFVGSGTVMTESMLLGLNFYGQDINPLAVLICKTKMGPFYHKALKTKIDTLIKEISKDRSSKIEIDFPNIFKWFRRDVAIELSKIRRSIARETSKWARRFFWVALAETVRLSSNSRTSTFKLHARPPEEIPIRQIFPIDVFNKILKENYKKLLEINELLSDGGFIKNSHYSGEIDIKLADSRHTTGTVNPRGIFDLLVTSPPYGDNVTTVPYGQYSYLPLQWIDLPDIADNIDPSCLSSTHEIDRRSLGGSRESALDEIQEIKRLSETFSLAMKNLEKDPRDRMIRLAAFCRDLDKCIDPILGAIKPNAYMIWTIGNRMIGKKTVPMDEILSELLIARNAKKIMGTRRTIPSKRMAIKNNFADTMRMETILLFKKGSS